VLFIFIDGNSTTIGLLFFLKKLLYFPQIFLTNFFFLKFFSSKRERPQLITFGQIVKLIDDNTAQVSSQALIITWSGHDWRAI
jgi:hypothetical protein